MASKKRKCSVLDVLYNEAKQAQAVMNLARKRYDATVVALRDELKFSPSKPPNRAFDAGDHALAFHDLALHTATIVAIVSGTDGKAFVVKLADDSIIGHITADDLQYISPPPNHAKVAKPTKSEPATKTATKSAKPVVNLLSALGIKPIATKPITKPIEMNPAADGWSLASTGSQMSQMSPLYIDLTESQHHSSPIDLTESQRDSSPNGNSGF